MTHKRQYLAVFALAIIGISMITVGAAGLAAKNPDHLDPIGGWTMFSGGEPVSCWEVYPYDSTIAENLTLYRWEMVNCTS